MRSQAEDLRLWSFCAHSWVTSSGSYWVWHERMQGGHLQGATPCARRDRAEAEERLNRQVEALQARCSGAEAECAALRGGKHAAEAGAASLAQRLAAAEGSCSVRTRP